MMAGKMAERVARAIAWSDLDGEARKIAGSPAEMWLDEDKYLPAARAAIEAMSDTTIGMQEAGLHVYSYGPLATYAAMIDYALKD